MINSKATQDFDSRSSINKMEPRPIPTALKAIRFAFGVIGHATPTLAGYLAYKLWFTPTRFKTPASEQSALQSSDIEHHLINDESIVTYHWGQSGPTILMVHGWSGRGTQLGHFVEPLIKAGYQVLSFDAPAHGKSSGKQTNLYQVADTIVELQKIYDKFDAVITHSFGGPCTAVAIQRGLITSRVISISPPASTKGLIEKFIHTLNIPKKAGINLIARIESTFGKNIWRDISMKNTVRELNIPAMIIHDDQDKDVPWQEGQLIAQSWKNSQFIKTTGLGHRRILRDASVIESTVNFIAITALTKLET